MRFFILCRLLMSRQDLKDILHLINIIYNIYNITNVSDRCFSEYIILYNYSGFSLFLIIFL